MLAFTAEIKKAPRQRWLAPPVCLSVYDLHRCSDEELTSVKVLRPCPAKAGFRQYLIVAIVYHNVQRKC